MSDPYRGDPSLDPNRNPNPDLTPTRRAEMNQNNSTLWVGLAIAAVLLVGGYMYLNSDQRNVAQTNAPVSTPSTPSTTPSTPSTTGSGTTTPAR